MPYSMNYAAAATSSTPITTASRSKTTKDIIQEAIVKYKKSFKRFDILIFLQNEAEANYLIEHSLKLIRENLNILDLTKNRIDGIEEYNDEPQEEEKKEDLVPSVVKPEETIEPRLEDVVEKEMEEKKAID